MQVEIDDLKSKEVHAETLDNLFNTDKTEITGLRNQTAANLVALSKHDTTLVAMEQRINKDEADLGDTCQKIQSIRERLATLEERTSRKNGD